MENNLAAEVTSATNRNIILGIVDKNSTRNAVARKSGIPTTTFSRKLDGHGSFTILELGSIAEALDCELADILPTDLISPGITA